MALTYTAIASVTVGSGGASNIEFTSIPATYTDLLVFYSLRGTGPGSDYVNNRISFNGSTSGYASALVYGIAIDSGGAYNAVTNAIDYASYSVDGGSTASTFSNNTLYIPNYAGSNAKSCSIEHATEKNADSAPIVGHTSGYWSGTAAITSIKVAPTSGNFAQYSSATLYGIKNTV